MSSISFTSPSGSVSVSGRERAMMGSICNRFRQAQTGTFEHDDLEWLIHVAKPGHYLHTYAAQLAAMSPETPRYYEERRHLALALDTHLHVGGDDNALIIDGEPVDVFC